MRIALLVLATFSTIILTSCSTPPPPPPTLRFKPTAPNVHQNANIALAEAAKSVNQSLIQLNATEQAAYPPKDIAEPPSPSTYGMNVPASLEWNGPVEPALQALAKATNYTFKTIGKPPSTPILIFVSQNNSNVGDIVRNIGLQCKKRASVVVYPKSKTIELRYKETG